MTYANSVLFGPRTETSVRDIRDTAEGDESRIIQREYDSSVAHYLIPYSRQWNNPIVRFITLKAQWQSDTATLSSAADIAMHPAYQQIIGMGPIALPFILSDLRQKRSHWFWALKSIAGEDPVIPAERGNIKKMTEAWLKWGKEQGYV